MRMSMCNIIVGYPDRIQFKGMVVYLVFCKWGTSTAALDKVDDDVAGPL